MYNFRKPALVGGGLAAASVGAAVTTAPPAHATQAFPIETWDCNNGTYQWGAHVTDDDYYWPHVSMNHNCPSNNGIAFRTKVRYWWVDRFNFAARTQWAPIEPNTWYQMNDLKDGSLIQTTCYAVKNQNGTWNIRHLDWRVNLTRSFPGCPADMGNFWEG